MYPDINENREACRQGLSILKSLEGAEQSLVDTDRQLTIQGVACRFAAKNISYTSRGRNGHKLKALILAYETIEELESEGCNRMTHLQSSNKWCAIRPTEPERTILRKTGEDYTYSLFFDYATHFQKEMGTLATRITKCGLSTVAEVRAYFFRDRKEFFEDQLGVD